MKVQRTIVLRVILNRRPTWRGKSSVWFDRAPREVEVFGGFQDDAAVAAGRDSCDC